MTLRNICHPRSGSGGRVRTCGLINHNLCTRLNHQNSLCSRGYLGARAGGTLDTHTIGLAFQKLRKILWTQKQPFLKEGILRLTDAPKDPKQPISIPCPWSVTKCAYLSFPRSTMADIMVMRTTKLLTS